MKRIAVLSSGGDSPGMNAAIRAVVRTAIYNNIDVYGIRRGYQGLIEGDLYNMKTTDVSNIIQRGGTILKTARSHEFTTLEGRAKAYKVIVENKIEGLVLIGGDGTLRGAEQFYNDFPIPSIGIPGTIDNDLSGTDLTIGFDTAVNTAMQAIDKIRDTADAHNRIFIVEVMGRDAGYIALNCGIACGAEDTLIPEMVTNIDFLISNIKNDKCRKKLMHLIVVAEGDDFGGAIDVQNVLRHSFPELDIKSCILGHIQRGGSPTYADRVLASRLGYNAVLGLIDGQSQKMVGVVDGKIVFTSYKEVVKKAVNILSDFQSMLYILST